MLHQKSSELSTKIMKGEPIRLTFHYHTRDIVRFINSMMLKLLAGNDMSYLQTIVETVIREMIVNAVKANSKRLYFQKQGMDIWDENQYFLGMENFKAFIVEQQNSLVNELRELGYRVDVIVKKDDGGFRVMVRNNAPLLPTERERISMRIAKAREYNDFAEIYMDIGDDVEGEGLGIPLTILFLKNSGMGAGSFSINSNDKLTQSAFTIPFNVHTPEIKSRLQQEIIESMDALPSLPEYINQIEALCETKDVSIAELADKVSLDPSLAASVLRLSNSGGFVTVRRIDNLHDAIMIIGLKNLKAMLVTIGARKILDQHFSEFRDVWKHCNKTAFYARLIAEKFRLGAVSDKIYLASLLHDLGKIVLLSIDARMLEWITDISIKRKIRTSTVIEEVSIGLSHSTIGSMIAEKWKLPAYITDTIANHHSPLKSGKANRDIVFVTYLANKLCLIEEKKFDYYFFEDEVLQRFNLDDEKVFNALHDELKRNFAEQKA
jgi:putative nucleotidyltransferase with HDIG domain